MEMYPGKVNSPATTLASGISDSDVIILLVNSSVLPTATNLAVIGTGEDAETILYETISGNYLTDVTREFQGTKKAWDSGTLVARVFTEYDYEALRTNVEDCLVWSGTGTVDTTGTPEDNDFAKFTDADTIEGRSYAEVKQDLDLEIGTDVLAQQTIGIADNNLVEVDDDLAADNDYVKFTASGLEGRNYAEVKGDLSLNSVENTALSTWAGTVNIVTVGTLSAGDVTTQVSAASTTLAGRSELATAAETTTGTDTTRTVTPDGLAGSDFGKRIMYVKVIDSVAALTIGDGKTYITIPQELNGMNLVSAHASVHIPATGATLINVQISTAIRNKAAYVHDVLSTAITIDTSEYDSYTAATPPVINVTYDDVVCDGTTGADQWRIDVDAIGNTTPGSGLDMILTFQLP
jgi:hypothetical protein